MTSRIGKAGGWWPQNNTNLDSVNLLKMLSAKCHSFCSDIINTLRPRKDGCRFPGDIFRCIFLNKNISISINISLKVIPNGQINNIPALVRIMAWRRPGEKPLSEPMMFSLLMHICITRPQWVNVKISPKMGQWKFIGVLLQLSSVLLLSSLGTAELTNCGWDKMATVLQMTFSNSFSWKLYFHSNFTEFCS